MMRLQLLRLYQPMTIIESDGVDAKEVKEWYPEYPAIFEEVACWQHCKRHIDVCQAV